MNYYWWYTTPQIKTSVDVVSSARVKGANKRLDNAYAGGVFLGELKDSLSMILNPIKGGVKLLRGGFRRSKKFRSKARRKEYLSSWWLEARYGWIPLANDIAEIHERICLGVQRANKFFTTHASEKCQVAQTDEVWYTANTMIKVLVRKVQTWDTSARSTYGWEYVVGHENGELLSLMGLHYHDIPGIAWELVPLSFVIDWWLKVGDFLQYLRPTPYLAKLGEGYSIKSNYKLQFIPIRTQVYNRGWWYDVRNPSQTLEINQQSYQRVIPTSPVSAPIFDPRFKSIKHMADAGSLLIQKLWR